MATGMDDAHMNQKGFDDMKEYLRGSEFETSDTYITEMATIAKNASVTPPEDDDALSFQGMLDYLTGAGTDAISDQLDYYDQYGEAVTSETNLAVEILYDCGICPTKQVSGNRMYCCLNCERNTCSNCFLASKNGDMFCSQMCACDWEETIKDK